MSNYIVRGDGLSPQEAMAYVMSGNKMDEVFACDITGIMREYEEALDFISEVVVFGETEGFALTDWNFFVVGCEDGNILHLRIMGTIEHM